jgi:glycosyltransferase involved in cell wall biosynthesis
MTTSSFERDRPASQVTVVIPSYNCGALVCTAIESVLAQTLQPVDILVVDDGSTDGTAEVLELFIKKGQIRYIYQNNRGLPGARNVGIVESRSRYLAFLDADDSLSPDALAVMFRALEESGAAWCVSDILKIRATGHAVERSEIPIENPLLAVLREDFIRRAMFFRRECLIEVGMYDDKMKNREDWDINIRMIECGQLFAYVARPLYRYTWRANSITTKPSLKLLQFTESLMRKHHKRLADAGDRRVAKIYAHNLWALARQYLYDSGDLKAALRCIKESVVYDPDARRIVHPLLHHVRRVARRVYAAH